MAADDYRENGAYAVKQRNIAVTEIQRFSTHDGPGIRTVVFLAGCPLACAWCHIPEARTAENHIFYIESRCIGCGECALVCPRRVHTVGASGHTVFRKNCIGCGLCTEACPTGALENTVKQMTCEEIMRIVLRDQVFYRENGGLTLSGGEPLAQRESAMRLLKEAKERGIGTAVETCGYAEERTVLETAEYTDLFLWDVKDTDPVRHRNYTGASNELILRNLLAADRAGAATILRCILVEGVNTDPAHYDRIAELFKGLRHCRGVQLLPYHTYGSSKALQMGLSDPARKEWIPSAERLREAREQLKKKSAILI